MYRDIPKQQWTVEYAPAKYKMFETKAEADAYAKYLNEINPSTSHYVCEEYSA
jgi:dsDNA-binding SOS-regulon protein